MKIIPKTPEELAIMRTGGKILHKILHILGKHAKVGTTPKQLDALAHELCKKHNVRPAFYGYKGFPAAICTSVNNAVVHGIPNDTPLKKGDIIGIDLGIEHKGLCTDSAYTFAVGKIPTRTELFLQTIQKALAKAIEIAKDGVQLGDIGAVISSEVISKGYTIVEELGGHGIGKHIHEPPHIYNYGKTGTGMVLKEGMTIALEPIVNMGRKEIFTDKEDKWTIYTTDESLSGHFEHTIAIGKEHGEILT